MPLLWLAEYKNVVKFIAVLINGLVQIGLVAYAFISLLTMIFVYLFFKPDSLNNVYKILGAPSVTFLILYLAFLYIVLEFLKYGINVDIKGLFAIP